MLEAYLATLVGVALAQASPGPNFLAVVGAALGSGRAAALWTVLGVASGMVVWALLAAFGLGALVTAVPATLTWMKIAGGAYLAWLAFGALVAAWRGVSVNAKARRSPGRGAAWRHGLFVVLTNPKALLMWTAVGTFLFGSGLSTVEVALFGPVGMISALVIYGAYGLLFSTGFAAKLYARFARAIEALLGAAFGALGGRLLWDGVRELRGA